MRFGALYEVLVLPCISYELFRAKHDVSLRVVPEMSLGSGHSSWVRASPILLLIEIGHKLVPDLGIRALAYRLLRKRANQFFIPVHGCSGHLDCFALVRSRATVVCLVLEIKTFKAVCHQIVNIAHRVIINLFVLLGMYFRYLVVLHVFAEASLAVVICVVIWALI